MKLCRLLLALLFPVSTAFMYASNPETEIRVVVKNDFNKPVANAAVILDFLGGRQIQRLGMKKPTHWEIHTNQAGLAHFPPIPEGTIQLQVITKKYQTYGQKTEISGAEKLFEITLHVPQDQYSSHAPLKPADPPKP